MPRAPQDRGVVTDEGGEGIHTIRDLIHGDNIIVHASARSRRRQRHRHAAGGARGTTAATIRGADHGGADDDGGAGVPAEAPRLGWRCSCADRPAAAVPAGDFRRVGRAVGAARRLARLPRAAAHHVGAAAEHQVCRLGRRRVGGAHRSEAGRAPEPAAAQRDRPPRSLKILFERWPRVGRRVQAGLRLRLRRLHRGVHAPGVLRRRRRSATCPTSSTRAKEHDIFSWGYGDQEALYPAASGSTATPTR